MAKSPATTFKEVIAPGEEEKFNAYTQKLRAIQKTKSKKYGNGRLLHRKGTLALKAELIIDGNLPSHAAQGIFKSPGNYSVIIRLSNGSFDIKSDKAPDIRGFALKVNGVKGASALNGKATTEQDFVMINHSTFASARAEDFLDLLVALTTGPGALLKHLGKKYGFFGSFKVIGNLAKVMGKKFTSYATENFSTVLPIKNGTHAVKLRIRAQNTMTAKPNKADLAQDLRIHLQSQPLTYLVELQFFTDGQTTPIEDASAEWSEVESPFIPVGKLIIPVQVLEGPAYASFAAEVEKLKFDPWNALEDHRPLGNVMRARKAAYYASQQGRGV